MLARRGRDATAAYASKAEALACCLGMFGDRAGSLKIFRDNGTVEEEVVFPGPEASLSPFAAGHR